MAFRIYYSHGLNKLSWRVEAQISSEDNRQGFCVPISAIQGSISTSVTLDLGSLYLFRIMSKVSAESNQWKSGNYFHSNNISPNCSPLLSWYKYGLTADTIRFNSVRMYLGDSLLNLLHVGVVSLVYYTYQVAVTLDTITCAPHRNEILVNWM